MTAEEKPSPASLGVPIGLSLGALTTRICLGNININDSHKKITSAIISNEDGERFTPSFATMEDGFQVIGAGAQKIFTRLHGNTENSGNMLSKSLGMSHASQSDQMKPFMKHMAGLAVSAGSIPESQGPERVRVVIGRKSGSSGEKEVEEGLKGGFGAKSLLSFIDEGVAVAVAHGLSAMPSAMKNIETSAERPPEVVCQGWKKCVVVNWGASGFYFSEVERVAGGGLLNLVKSEVGGEGEGGVGGEVIVDTIFKFVSSQFTRKNPGLVVDSKKSIAKLREAVVSALKVLGLSRTCAVEVDGLVEGVDCRVSLSRGRVEMLCGDVMSKFADSLKKFVGDSGADVMLMAGGVCKMPAAREVVKNVGGENCWYGLECVAVDEAVVTGCCIQATLLNHSGLLSFEENESLFGLGEIGVTSLTFEAGVEGGEKVQILRQGTPMGVFCHGVVKDVQEGEGVKVFMDGKSIVSLDGVSGGDVEVAVKVGLNGAVEVCCQGANLVLEPSV